jgi:hypothetical protein
MGIAMIRAMISAAIVLGMGMAAQPAEAQYRVKTRFPWIPQHGSAPGIAFVGENRSAHFNPKEVTIGRHVPWQKSQELRPGTFAGRGLDIARVDGEISPMTRSRPYQLGIAGAPSPRHFAPLGVSRGMFRR